MKVKEKTMKIDDMKAGRELDALVAEKVMGWELHYPYAHDVENNVNYDLADTKIAFVKRFNPSTDIAAAWQVVEKMHLADPMAIIHISNGDGDSMDIDIIPGGVMSPLKLAHSKIENGTFEDFPLAICLAALKAIE